MAEIEESNAGAIAQTQGGSMPLSKGRVAVARHRKVSRGPVSGDKEDNFTGWSLVNASGRDPAIVAFEVAMVSFFVDAADLLGVPKSVAAIYGLCFASPGPLSFADLDERLEISMGSISQGVRVLRDVGALKVIGSHERREYFAPDLELRKLAARFIEERLEKQLKAGKSRLQAMKGAIPPGHSGDAKELRGRIKYLQSWHDQGRALLPLARTFLKL